MNTIIDYQIIEQRTKQLTQTDKSQERGGEEREKGRVIWDNIQWPRPGALSAEWEGHKPSHLDTGFCRTFLLP